MFFNLGQYFLAKMLVTMFLEGQSQLNAINDQPGEGNTESPECRATGSSRDCG